MKTSNIAAQKCLRAPSTPADSGWTRRECRLDPAGRLAVFCVAPLLACAAVLTTTLPAAGQAPEPAPVPAPEGSPEAAPAAPAPAPTPEASPEASPAAPGGALGANPEASPPPPAGEPEEVADFIQAEGVEEIVVSGFRSSLSAALDRKQR